MAERRLDPTTGEWVTVAGERQYRTYRPDEDACPLCPTTSGASPTEVPRPAFDIAVFDNLFPSLRLEPAAPAVTGTPLLQVEPAVGHCEVVVYTDDHSAGLATVGVGRVRLLVEVWAERTRQLGALAQIAYVMPFENRGEAVGVTLSHPHGQIFGYPDIPPRPRRELDTATAYRRTHRSCVWCDLVAAEDRGPRVVVAGAEWVAAVPWWARWPYQVELWPRRHVPGLPDLSAAEASGLAEILSAVATAYDALFGFPLPYILAVHQQPTDGGDWAALSHLHVELDPPHRSRDRLKHLAGSETGAGAYLSDVAPEEAAADLRRALARAAVPR